MGFREEYEMKLEEAAKKTKLSVDQVRLLVCWMDRTWNDIASDWLEAMIGQNSRKTIPRSEVVEAVIDADRLMTTVKWNLREEKQQAAVAVVELYYKLPDLDRKVIDKIAFPDKRYGW